MGKVKVTVRNSTAIFVKLEEGHNQVNTIVEGSILGPNGKFKLKVDNTVTYKEYSVIRITDSMRLEPMYTGDALIKFTKEVGFKEMVVKMKEDSNPPEHFWEPSYNQT